MEKIKPAKKEQTLCVRFIQVLLLPQGFRPEGEIPRRPSHYGTAPTDTSRQLMQISRQKLSE